jgi:HAMP domain-containing protein
MRERRHGVFGFGLLEALVALVLIAGVGFSLLAWVQQNLDTLQRLRQHYAEQEIRRQILDWAVALNPMERPQGELALGGTRLVWSSERQGDERPQSGYPAGMGLHDVALFSVTIEAYPEGREASPLTETLLQVGYRQTRSGRNPFE